MNTPPLNPPKSNKVLIPAKCMQYDMVLFMHFLKQLPEMKHMVLILGSLLKRLPMAGYTFTSMDLLQVTIILYRLPHYLLVTHSYEHLL